MAATGAAGSKHTTPTADIKCLTRLVQNTVLWGRPPVPLLKAVRADADRLRAHIEANTQPQEDGCLIWTGSYASNGYGRLRINIEGEWRSPRVTRVQYVLHHDVEPGELLVLHSCDRPECCAIEHLRLGTAADNAADKCERGRVLHGAAHPLVKLTAEQALLASSMLQSHTDRQIVRVLDLPVTHSAIYSLRQGWSWARVTGIRPVMSMECAQ